MAHTVWVTPVPERLIVNATVRATPESLPAPLLASLTPQSNALFSEASVQTISSPSVIFTRLATSQVGG